MHSAIFQFNLAVLIVIAALAAGCTVRYQVIPLDIHSDEAIAACSRAGGLAGWLQLIAEDGEYVGAADVYCVVKR
jgi:acyl-CoA reductase-like NAD-dependent aldehyde dehydrogenase